MPRKLILLAILCISALSLPAAAGPLQLRVGPNFGADTVDAVVAPGAGTQSLDLVFVESGQPYNELLFAYDAGVDAAQPGLRLVRAEKPDNWVLTGSDSDTVFTEREARPDHILVNASYALTYSGPLADITTGAKVARIYYSIDPGTAPGLYRITLDRNTTVFGTGNPNCSCPIFPDLSDAGVVLVTPEPSGVALVGVAWVLALRRPFTRGGPRSRTPRVAIPSPSCSKPASCCRPRWWTAPSSSPERPAPTYLPSPT